MNGKNKWNAAQFRRVLTRAGHRIECSWGVMGLRNHRTGEMETILLFNDDDGKRFAYAFSFTRYEEVVLLCTYLITMADKIRREEFRANG